MTNDHSLPRSTPEAEGISSRAVLAFLEGAQQQDLELHSLMIVRHGKVIAQAWWRPYGPEIPHQLFSLSKSFTSSAVGLAVAEGRLSVDDPVISFFPDDLPEVVSENLAAMKVRHLLSMSTGHAKDATGPMVQTGGANWVRGFLSLPVELEPGSLFVYNSAATYMLSAIVHKLTGQRLLDYLTPRLFEPLGITGAAWETCPAGIDTGGWGLSIKTEDIARFGQLYLQKGQWQGRQVLPQGWVEEATRKHIDNAGGIPDWSQGYGYQFWRCQHGNYRGDGAFGQFCVVLPQADAVLAITSAVDDMQAVLTLAWEHLLPAMQGGALPADEPTLAELHERAAALEYLPPTGVTTSALEQKLSGKTYRFAPNELNVETATFTFAPETITLNVRAAGEDQQAVFGRAAWQKGVTNLLDGNNHGAPHRLPQKTAASAIWAADDTLSLTLRHYETPFTYTIRACFIDGMVELAPTVNHSFGPLKLPVVMGEAKE